MCGEDGMYQVGSRRRQRGAIAVLASIMAVVLIGIGGVALDFGRLYVTRTELQSAMDSCALAAANQLQPGPMATALVLQAADAHGRAMVDPSRLGTFANRAYFQRRDVSPGDVQVTFSDMLDGSYASLSAANPQTARFARCTFPMGGIATLVSQVLNILPGPDAVAPAATVAASAVATRAPNGGVNPTNNTTCGLFPIAVCMRGAGQTAATNWGLTPGQWIPGPDLAGSPAQPGTFGWIDFSPPAGGASELASLMAGGGHCGTVAVGQEVGEAGKNTSVLRAWASRFGVYANGGGLSEATNPPDYTGHAYTRSSYPPAAGWTSGSSAPIDAFRNDYLARRAAATTFNPTGAGYSNNHFNATRTSTSEQLYNYGRLRRVVVAPVVECPYTHTVPVEGYACIFLLRPYALSGPQAAMEDSTRPEYSPEIEYIGTLDDPDTPCRLNGGIGGPGGSGGSSLVLVPRLVQ